MKILSLLQARTTSSRLPGKVLKPLLGRPMILRQIERLQRVRHLGELMVVTSDHASDDSLADLCRSEGVSVFRGSLDDVLDRFYQAAKPRQPDHVVRLTADCPLADPTVIDRVITRHLEGGFDYTSNAAPPTFPDGLDVEVFRFCCLEEAWHEARLPSQREHVTPFIHGQPGRYKVHNVRNDRDLSALRWTVDESQDFDLVERIYSALYPRNPAFLTADVLRLLADHPDWLDINGGIQRNEGLAKSLLADLSMATVTAPQSQEDGEPSCRT